MYQLITNLSFDQEKEWRMRLFCKCPKWHKSDDSNRRVWLCLYGLDTFTQNELITGVTSKEAIIHGEVNEYFEESEEKNELKIEEKWMHKFQNLSREDWIYKDMKLDIETIMKIKLSNDYYKFFV